MQTGLDRITGHCWIIGRRKQGQIWRGKPLWHAQNYNQWPRSWRQQENCNNNKNMTVNILFTRGSVDKKAQTYEIFIKFLKKMVFEFFARQGFKSNCSDISKRKFVPGFRETDYRVMNHRRKTRERYIRVIILSQFRGIMIRKAFIISNSHLVNRSR